MKIPLGVGSYRRKTAQEPEIVLRNRYFEANPTNQENQVALLVRPALRRWLEVGTGPVRATYSQNGAFDNALFVVSGEELWRINTDETMEMLQSGIFGNGLTANVSMAATPEFLFIADGKILYVYDGATCAQVVTPDDVGIISVGFNASYIICVVAQGFGFNGRFYWIEPGEIIIDPLNFATAERAPDPVYNVICVGDQFWLPGANSTEVWYFTGDPDAPVSRVQGRLFDRGVWEGCAVAIKDSMIMVDADGRVYDVASGADPISTPDIEERIRKAIATQMRLEI